MGSRLNYCSAQLGIITGGRKYALCHSRGIGKV
jgi:hypothetical protein